MTRNQFDFCADKPPLLIAEISANHQGCIQTAKDIILSAAKSGADAVKIQSYEPDTMTLDCKKQDFLIKDGLWKNRSLYQLYGEACTPFAWHRELFDFANKNSIILFSSPFDESAVDLLEELNTPAYKIASFEITDIPLVKYVASTKKPLLISTGMASLDEIDDVVKAALSEGCENLLLFHCVSSYPALTEDANLQNISILQKRYKLPIGLSDHTNSNIAAISATAIGVRAIEKHFTLDRSSGGVDAPFSIEPSELVDLSNSIKQSWSATCRFKSFNRPHSELSNIKFRRSLYFSCNLPRGHIVREDDIRRVRPGYGLSAKFFPEVLGKKLRSSVSYGDRVSWSAFE